MNYAMLLNGHLFSISEDGIQKTKSEPTDITVGLTSRAYVMAVFGDGGKAMGRCPIEEV